jgi:hypothetical protein
MKSSLFVFVFALITMGNALAQATGSITVFAEDGERFWLIIDGNRINQEPAANVKVDELTKAFYRAKVIFEDASIPEIDQNVAIQDIETNQLMGVTYMVKENNRGKWVLRMSSFNQAAPSTASQVMHYNDASGTVSGETNVATTNSTPTAVPSGTVTTTTTTTTTTKGAPAETVNVRTNVGGIGISMTVPNMETDMTTKQTYTETTTTQTTVTQSSPAAQPAAQPAAPAEPKGCTTAMSSSAFSSAKSSIKNQSFTEGQMKVAKQILRSNCLNVSQIIEVMDIFSFEDSKVEFAKAAYAKCVDQGNYFQVNDAFTFSGSVDELNEFLDMQ